MFCQKCGKENSGGTKFCGNCGANTEIVAEANMKSEISSVVDQHSKNISLMTWIGTIFFGFIPGFLFYLFKKDEPYIQDQAKEALNWSITVIALIAPIMFMMRGLFAWIKADADAYPAPAFDVIDVIVALSSLSLILLIICHLVFCVLGAVAASNGKAFRVPFAYRLFK